MHPTTIIEIFMLFGVTLGMILLALLLSKKFRKIVWSVSGLVIILGICFYGTRPFIVQHQTREATEELEKHFKDIYPEDSWSITDTNEHEIQSVVYLHVIFESEPKIVYEYTVKNSTIEQVSMWMLSGHSVEESGVELRHEER